MEWADIIEGNRVRLLRIVAALLELAGLAEDGKMRRHMRNYLMRILRPAESAARRLIVIAARQLIVELRPPSVHGHARSDGGQGLPVGAATDARPAAPAFPLLDPLKRFSFAPARRISRCIPRILFLDGPTPPPPPPGPSPDDMVDATCIGRRLAALRRALDDIDAQARRLARWRATCDRGPDRFKRSFPLRPGYPPGRRQRQIHEVDEILRNCHLLALHALSPDSS